MKKCQQWELYDAERDVPHGKWFASTDEAEAWISEIRETLWFRDNFPTVQRFELHPRSVNDGSVGTFIPLDGVVLAEMASEHLNNLIICHEVSHGLAAARYQSRSHDPWFARIYLELVWHMLGTETYEALRASFDQHGIDHDPGPESTHAMRKAIIL